MEPDTSFAIQTKPFARELETGQMISHYRVERRLGAGGMGVVYLAHDTQLNRPVALKLLQADLTQNPARVSRFRQEARAVSALNHPNILTIYKVGQAKEKEGGAHFIATEFVDGQTLREHCRKDSLPLGKALDVLIQVAAALTAAHEAGIIHRDIKPENIMLRRDGLVKVLDFGLAKLTDKWRDREMGRQGDGGTERHKLSPSPHPPIPSSSFSTAPGIVMGTVSYMSPEQARGLEVDHRSDLFSLGVVMYELLSGHAPFTGETTADVLAALLSGDPRPLNAYRTALPAALQEIVNRALAKPLDERYQSARAIGDDLKRLKEELEFEAKLKGYAGGKDDILMLPVGATANSAEQTTFATRAIAQPAAKPKAATAALSPRNLSLIALALLLTLTALIYWQPWRGKTIDSVAVLPFVNATNDPQMEYLSDGLTESLIDNLSQLTSLRVISRSAAFVYKDRETDPVGIGKNLKVSAVVKGRVLQEGNQFHIQLELLRTADAESLWSETFQGPLNGVLALQEELSRNIAQKLRQQLSNTERTQIAKRQTQNSEAFPLYLQGIFYWNKRTAAGMTQAMDYFKQAIEKDPSYAMAYVGLSDAYSALSAYHVKPPMEVMPPAREAAAHALRIDDQLAEAHASMGRLLTDYYWDWDYADREFQRAIQLKPGYSNTHLWYSSLLASLGKFDDAVREANLALELDNYSPVARTQLGSILYRSRRYDEAVAVLQKMLDQEPNSLTALNYLALCHLKQEKYDDAISEFQKAVAAAPKFPDFTALLGFAYGLTGQPDRARQSLAKLDEFARITYVAPSNYGAVYAGLGNLDKAFEYLEKTYEERSPNIRALKTDPIYDVLRNDARFTEMLRRVKLAP
ncbi:MAG TPA: protein kinase [Blastocatellia bacterium]|nr:protein kinase [Blastocatellia bacterium]HMZ22029.1 protein kinase [Blastocatellia bacterium]HNG33362.1 protein kinase [Blastocatellia bacterium]